jgi:ArsR family transcriptional regulator, arsenate/arsenite/antimonite-responsive transcriptional repressor
VTKITETQTIEILKVLAVHSRFQIVKLISHRQYCVNALAQRVGISQSAVSQHLKILKDCKLVFARRYGSIVHYRLDTVRMDEFLNALNETLTYRENEG